MKIEPSNTESSSDEDPITAAAALLVLAVDQARRDIVAARSEPSPALVASEAKREALEAKVRDLEDALELRQADLHSAHTICAQRDAELADSDRMIAGLQRNLDALTAQRSVELVERDRTVAESQKNLNSAHALATQRDAALVDRDRKMADLDSSRMLAMQLEVKLADKDRTISALEKNFEAVRTLAAEVTQMLVKERAASAASAAGLAKEKDALRLERDNLTQAQAKLQDDKRAALENLERTVGTMQAEVAKQQHLFLAPAPASTTGAPHSGLPCPLYLSLVAFPATVPSVPLLQVSQTAAGPAAPLGASYFERMPHRNSSTPAFSSVDATHLRTSKVPFPKFSKEPGPPPRKRQRQQVRTCFSASYLALIVWQKKYCEHSEDSRTH
jgi:hypothetical protein